MLVTITMQNNYKNRSILGYWTCLVMGEVRYSSQNDWKFKVLIHVHCLIDKPVVLTFILL